MKEIKKILKELNGKPTKRTDNIVIFVFFTCFILLILQEILK